MYNNIISGVSSCTDCKNNIREHKEHNILVSGAGSKSKSDNIFRESCLMRSSIIAILGAVVVLLFLAVDVMAAGRLFFTTIVERNDDGEPQVVAEWGALDGELPAEINSFRLYRSEDGGSFTLLKELSFEVAPVEVIAKFALNDTVARFQALIADLSRISTDMGGEEIDESNFAEFLFQLLSPSGVYYDPLRAMLLTRAHLAAAMGQGLAYVDTKINPSSSYKYMLTAVTASGESLPVGQSGIVKPSVETVLPAPTGLRQVRLSTCSSLRGGLDDNLIHMVWDLPVRPEELGLKAVIYGYDIFWSESDRGVLDFRNGIPAGLHRVNPAPILASGPPPAHGPDSFLAVDSAENHTEGPEWRRGQPYYYYLVARDIAGHYSAPVPAVRLEVVDAMPPRAVWNAHSEEIAETDATSGTTTSRLALVWDQHNSTNFVREYGTNRVICSASGTEVCYVNQDETCDGSEPRCADLDVENYLVFRFDSPRAASEWGTDSDGDHWPDDIEEEKGTDPCDAASKPVGEPSELAAVISPDDASHYRDITPVHRQMYFVDTDVVPDNHVYWYRIVAVDSQGNQSPLSPPIRGVLYDRTQPEPDVTLYHQYCTYSAQLDRDCGGAPDQETLLVLKDNTGDAVSFKFFQVCTMPEHPAQYRVLASGAMEQNQAFITYRMLERFQCRVPDCGNKWQSDFVVRFYDDSGKVLAETAPFDLEYLCYFAGCVYLDKACRDVSWTTPSFVPVPPVKVCVNLQEGEMARVYYQTPTGMSPFRTFDPAPATDQYCETLDNIEGITPADICLGVRVFSQNHVGSRMKFLGCLELHAQSGEPLKPPVLSPVEPVEEGERFLRLMWSEPAAGVGSFIVEITGDNGTEYTSLWGLEQDEAGRFVHLDQITESEIGEEFCYRVRALSSDMQASDWSNRQCGKWEVVEQPYLAWPPVKEPQLVSEKLSAFYLKSYDEERPVLVLSPDLDTSVELEGRCVFDTCDIQDSQSKFSCLSDRELQFYNCPACSYIRSQIVVDNFIVYRQEEGHDFVQVSPLIEQINCRVEDHGEILDILHDPFVFLLNVDERTVLGVDDASLGSGIRILFKDRYPFRGGTRIRYKVMEMNRATGEPEREYTSNWVTVP